VTDLRVPALLLLVATGLTFLAGVRKVFRRPPGPHRYHASRVSALVLLAEAAAIALRPVPPARFLAAAAILALALVLFRWAARTNRARPLPLAFAAHVPEHVQTDGPYRLVRHPFYASYLLAFVGGFVAAGTALLLPLLALGIATYWRAARSEEASFASSPLGGAYRAYARTAGMFLPRLFPARR
jgi:protein-S-isoprenylcysteine O-methyltransferase Ste14